VYGMTFRGIRKDYITIIRGRKRPPWAPLQRNILTVPGLPGGYLTDTVTNPRQIEVPVLIKANSFPDLQKLKEDLAGWLVTDTPQELIFDDEPDRVYFAVVDESLDLEEIVKWGHGIIRFICPDPYKYGHLRTQTINDPVSGEGNPIVNNEGTAETYPVFTAYVKQPITFLDIIAPDAYMRVGQPYTTDQTPVDSNVRVINDNMGSLTGWGSASAIDNGVIQGSFHVVSETFQVQDYGPTYNGWAGPALKKSVPNPIRDFQVKALIDITSSANGVGRIEIYGLDAANNFVFRMGIGDFSAKSKDVKAYWELGPSTDSIFSTYGKKKGTLNDYYGILVIQRKGNKWTFSTARRTSYAPVANYVDYVQSTYVDTKNKYTGQLAQIQIHIGTHLGYGPISRMSINHIEVFELRDFAINRIPYIAYPDDVLQFDHKNAVVYRNGEPIMSQKDFGARFFPLGPGATELVVNPSDAAVVEVEYRPRYK
jgi:predicted phage tail component-like protein